MEISSKHKIIIQFDENHTPEEIIGYVANLVEEGCTSGIDPNWEIVER